MKKFIRSLVLTCVLLAVPFTSWAVDVVLLSTQTASSSSSITFTSSITSTYPIYEVHFYGVSPASNDVDLYLRTSTDNGSNYDSSTTDYKYGSSTTRSSDGSVYLDVSDADSKIVLNAASLAGLNNASGRISSGTIRIYNPLSTTDRTHMSWDMTAIIASGSDLSNTRGGGSRSATADVDALEFTMSSGNIASGTFKLYGIK